MNILELNFERTWRGGERQTLFNMEGFRNAGHNVALVCRKGFPLEAKAIAAGFKVYSFGNVFGVFFFLLFQGRKYRMLHAQTSHILTWCILAKAFRRADIVFSRRVNFMPHGLMTMMKYRFADHIVAVSESVKHVLQEFGVKHISVISDIAVARPLDKERALSFLSEANVPAGKRIIGTIAAMGPDKDPLTMVEAIKILSAQRKDFILLHFGDGGLQPAVAEKIKEHGLEDVYKLMGFQNDIEDFYSVFDVFAMSSQQEGLGSSVLDAFLYHVTVVSTNAGGLADLLHDGRGVACRKGDAEGLANGMALILSQPQLAKEMSDKAYAYALKYHSMQYITDQYLALLQLK